jgi:hypothetical protein
MVLHFEQLISLTVCNPVVIERLAGSPSMMLTLLQGSEVSVESEGRRERKRKEGVV